MALSCLLTRMTASQCFLKGQALRKMNNTLIRSSALLSNRDSPLFLTAERVKSPILKNQTKLAFLPSCFPVSVKYSTAARPEPEYKKHSHVMVWRLERVLSAVMLPLLPAALIMPSPALDTAVAILIVMHTHWGLEAIVVDYVRPILFGELAPKIGLGLLYLFSAAMLAGLLNLIHNDFGLANAILHIWKS